MDKPKPCPFCGGKDISYGVHSEYGEIWCVECRASIKLYDKFFFEPRDAKKYYKPKLIEAWNRRVDGGKARSVDSGMAAGGSV